MYIILRSNTVFFDVAITTACGLLVTPSEYK